MPQERRVVGAATDQATWQERLDELNNKLAAITANGGLLAEMVEGEARQRAEGLLRGAWAAAEAVRALQGALDATVWRDTRPGGRAGRPPGSIGSGRRRRLPRAKHRGRRFPRESSDEIAALG